jgi:hypothetical protein
MFNVNNNGLGNSINPLNSAANVHPQPITLPQPVTGGRGTMLPNRTIQNTQTVTGAQGSQLAAASAGGSLSTNGAQPQPATTGGAAARPSGTYDPNASNAKEWRKYWNQSAGGTGDEQVHTMSKNDVWNMKANQRRRNGGGGQPKKVQATSPLPPADIAPTGNAVNTSLNWRAG